MYLKMKNGVWKWRKNKKKVKQLKKDFVSLFDMQKNDFIKNNLIFFILNKKQFVFKPKKEYEEMLKNFYFGSHKLQQEHFEKQ